MGKQVVTRYSQPLNDQEREEIKEILKPVLEEKERWGIAKELQVELLNAVNEFLTQVSPNFFGGHFPDGIGSLDKALKERANDWYSKYAPRLGPKIRPEDIHVSVSTDGLYVLTYSGTLKAIITKADFELETFTWAFPAQDHDLIQEVNLQLEQEPVE